MTSSTPKNSVKPTATSAYMTPSIAPLIRYWPRSETSTSGDRLEPISFELTQRQRSYKQQPLGVMAGLVPAIHVFRAANQVVDGPDPHGPDAQPPGLPG